MGQTVFVSATPGPYENEHTDGVAEQLIRPTGLLDPAIRLHPIEGQVDDLIEELRQVTARGERALVTTLTTKMAEDLTDYLGSVGIRVKYIHHKVETMERMEIVRDLRLGKFDVLIGINLLREGLDIPEVSLVAILDADKEGFLRSSTSLIQTIGRAARNQNGRVVMYADTVTGLMKTAIDETNRRRAVQSAYNEKNGITPRSVVKDVRDTISLGKAGEEEGSSLEAPKKKLSKKEKERTIERLKSEMRDAAKRLEFERAAYLRDRIRQLEEEKK